MYIYRYTYIYIYIYIYTHICIYRCLVRPADLDAHVFAVPHGDILELVALLEILHCTTLYHTII